MRTTDRQISLNMTLLVEYLSEDLFEYWDNPSDNHIGEIVEALDKLVNGGKATKQLKREAEYFADHRASLEQYIARGR